MTDKKRIKIIGTGMYVPDQVLTNADLEKMVDTSDEWITTRSGIKERHIARADQATSDMCLEAARRAIKNAHLEPPDIDMIIVTTVTPDQPLPTTACFVQAGLGLPTIPAFDMAAACTGFIYGLAVSEGMILTGSVRRVLLISAEMLTKVTNWKDRSTCVLFGDGAAAVILEESRDGSGLLSTFLGADGRLSGLLEIPAGGTRHPASVQTVAENHHTIIMKGNDVYKHAVKRMGESAEAALKKAGLTKDQVDVFIPHQANIRIIEAVGERLKIPREKVYVNIERFGNISAATIPVAIHELRQLKRFKPGSILLTAAFGGGFTWGGAVYRW
jgi:3-oxoacyl-[acyl-carrier-protein] synthase III